MGWERGRGWLRPARRCGLPGLLPGLGVSGSPRGLGAWPPVVLEEEDEAPPGEDRGWFAELRAGSSWEGERRRGRSFVRQPEPGQGVWDSFMAESAS